MKISNQQVKAKLQGIIWGVILVAVNACAADNIQIDDEAVDDLMRFTSGTETRALTNDFNKPGSTFGMNGVMCANGKDTLQVFAGQNQKAVYTSSTWDYTPLRYWHNSYEYLFVAYAPYRETGVNMNKGRVMISDYDALTQIDLMASAPVTRAPGMRAPVKFNFSHLLTQINVVIKSSNAWVSPVELTKFYVKGMNTTGTFTQGATQEWKTVNAPYNGNSFAAQPQTITTTGTNVINNLLMIPQAVSTNLNIRFEFEYVSKGITYKKEIVLALKGATTPWEIGKVITYTLTLTPNNIEFAPPEVKPWDSKPGGSFPIKPEDYINERDYE